MKSEILTAYANSALLNNWGYVWGGQGELYTAALAQKWGRAQQGGKNYSYFTETCKRWIGHNVADCSGLIIAAMQSVNANYPDQASGTLINNCSETGAIKYIPNDPGLLLWKPGHVGIYIGDGFAIEARGVAYGVVKTKLNDRPWTKWGRIHGVDYGDGGNTDESGTGHVSSMVIFRLLKKTKPMQVGDDVTWLQQQLTASGYSLGAIDGIFGSRTETAVKGFQRAQRLTVDGKAGRKTITALGGIYKA